MSYEPVDVVACRLSGMNDGGAMAVGGGGSLGGGGNAIIGGFDLSTTVSAVPVDGTLKRGRGSSLSISEETTESMDCLRSAVDVRLCVANGTEDSR